MKFFYLLLLGFLLPLFSLAQANYHQGYVVLNSSDTLRGYINTREWDKNPDAIEFKSNLADSRATTYTPATARFFEVSNIDRFVTYSGKLSTDATDINNIPPALDTATHQATVFLKVVTAGTKASLLSYTDQLKTRLFIQEQGQPPVELSYHVHSSAGNAMVVDNTLGYRAQLLQLAAKYNADNKTTHFIQVASYGVTDLKRAVSYLNQNQTININKVPNGRFFIGGGANYQSTSFTGSNLFTGINATSVAPFFSTGYDIFANPNTKRVAFRGELMVSYNSANFKATTHNYGVADGNASFKFNQLNFTVIPQIVYSIYSTDNLKVFIDAGFAFNFSKYSNTRYSNTTTYQDNVKDYYTLEGLWLSFPVKAGVLVNKRIELFAQYSFPTAYSNYNNFSVGTQTVGLGIHYCFDRSK
jgi:hypothetical protein